MADTDPLAEVRIRLDRAVAEYYAGWMTQGAADVLREVISAVSILLDGTDPFEERGE